MADLPLATTADEVASLLARFTVEADDRLSEETRHAAKRALFDAIAVATGAFRHRAAQVARRYAALSPVGDGATIWGTERRTGAESAALVNGVLLRCYDYNDLHVGKRSAGHPSDMVAGLVAIAEIVGCRGEQLLAALALGYEVTLDLLDCLAIARGGWDYANVTAIGATCAVAKLLRLDASQLREALAIATIPHFASDAIESGDLNSRGDLTLWKRFNGGDAIRQAVYACRLASCGVEGVVRPFTGRLGVLAKLEGSEDPAPLLRRRLADKRPLNRIAEVTMKRWPVGSRAQSAVQAALAARAQLPAGATIRQVRVAADPAAYEHLVRSRPQPWHPISRETADHSLPYIVAAALLDGALGSDSFAPSLVADPTRLAFLQKVTVSPDAGAAQQSQAAETYATAYRTRVEIETEDGATVASDADLAPGHPRNPLSERDLEAKLRECAGADLDTDRLIACLWRVDALDSLRDLTGLLAVKPGRDIESETVD